jgi:hypothetical protein
MKRRSFLHLLWAVPVVLFLRDKIALAPSPKPKAGPGHGPTDPRPDPRPRRGPVHECVDRPELPCPACMKWTGDPLAIQHTEFYRGQRDPD